MDSANKIDLMARPPDKPANLVEWLWYVRRYEAGIYVRQQDADGKWGNAVLADLPDEQWARHVAGWLELGHLPVRVREAEELEPLTPDPSHLKLNHG